MSKIIYLKTEVSIGEIIPFITNLTEEEFNNKFKKLENGIQH